jgi:hypothetical protein
VSDYDPCPKCGTFVYFVIAGSPDCECSCGHHWKRATPKLLRSIAGGSRWEDGVADEMRARLEEAIARDDRIAIFSVRRGHADAEPATVVTATADRRAPCSVTWVEFVGALMIKLHQWVGETESDDAK